MLLRLTKIIKIIKLFSYGDNMQENRIANFFSINAGKMRLLMLLITVCLTIHLCGCGWYYIAKLEDFSPDSWIFNFDLMEKSQVELYIASLYYVLSTLSTIGYGDITPISIPEKIFSIFCMLGGVCFYSFSIGILSSILSFLAIKEESLQKKINIMNEFCNEMKIPKSLQQRIRSVLEANVNQNSLAWAEKTKIFEELPINLRYDIAMNIHDGVLEKIYFFRKCKDKLFVVKAAPLLKPLSLKANDFLWATDDHPDSIFFLVDGRINYMTSFEEKPTKSQQILTPKQQFVIFKKMIQGSYFGEVEVILKKKRYFDAICETDCELYYIPACDYEFQLVSNEFIQINEQIRQIAIKRDTLCQNIIENLQQSKKEQTTPKSNQQQKKSDLSENSISQQNPSEYHKNQLGSLVEDSQVDNQLQLYKPTPSEQSHNTNNTGNTGNTNQSIQLRQKI
eukprot:TRINITY_DN8052_c0_g2_i1.p1 TRINITY_DN8052_c0_g2~~TRINITY_DN8052_c0_g2_i1.p1  ORF type:complete len:451 (+),score=54.94 TRINITY_DN8052_c0_g2_i1:23-1375(+)